MKYLIYFCLRIFNWRHEVNWFGWSEIFLRLNINNLIIIIKIHIIKCNNDVEIIVNNLLKMATIYNIYE